MKATSQVSQALKSSAPDSCGHLLADIPNSERIQILREYSQHFFTRGKENIHGFNFQSNNVSQEICSNYLTFFAAVISCQTGTWFLAELQGLPGKATSPGEKPQPRREITM